MTGSSNFTVGLTMDSDWHVGSGEGRSGSIDRLIDRDGDGLPYVPATTLRGMWRDAAERLAYGLDGGLIDGPWAKVVERIFGSQPAQVWRHRTQDGGTLGESVNGATDAGSESLDPSEIHAPVSSAISITDARQPESLRKALTLREPLRGDHPGIMRLRDALTFVKPGVGIRADTGRAEPDFLRFEEMARAGTELDATGTLGKGQDGRIDPKVIAFLIASAALVERLGGKRRRGSGRCRLRIAFAAPQDGWPSDIEAACRLLQDGAAPTYDPESESDVGEFVFRQRQDSQKWIVLPYRIEIETPVCAPSAIQGNIVTTLDFIPGFYLLPWVTEALSKAGDGAKVRAAIAAGDIRVSPAYPLGNSKESGPFGPVYPIPLSLAEEKDNDSAHWINRATPEGEQAIKDGGAQYKPVRNGFLTFAPSGKGAPIAYVKEPDKVTRTHNTVDDVVQRPTEDVGGVYSYEAIAPAVRLTGTIAMRDDAVGPTTDKASLRAALTSALSDERFCRLGRAGQGGYGRMRIEVGAAAAEPETAFDDGKLVLWCTTDLLLPSVSEEGASIVEAVANEIETLLERTGIFDRAEATCFARLRRYESWSKTWNLPRPSLIGIAAGSVIVLPVSGGDLTADEQKTIKTIAREGLGIRKAEGFGAVLVDPPLLRTDKVIRPKDKAQKPSQAINGPLLSAQWLASASSEQKRFVKLIERTAWQKAIAEAAEEFAASKERRDRLKWTPHAPGNSQLGALRAAMGAFNSEGDANMVRAWIRGVWQLDREMLAAAEARRAKARAKRQSNLGGNAAIIEALLDLLGDARENAPLPATAWTWLKLTDDADSLRSRLPARLLTSATQMRADQDMCRYAVAATLWAAMLYEKREREHPRTSTPGDATWPIAQGA